MHAAFAGLALGLSLIVAIGAQNAFVLRQGLMRSHVLAVCMVCAVSDAVLIAAGVAGFGALTTAVPWLETAMRWAGAGFLGWYGARTLLSAWHGTQTLAAGQLAGSLSGAVLSCLALTWLNPHVYLDTVMLLGAVSASYDNKLAFALGAMAGSFLFFFSLGYGARALAPVFARPVAWRWLDLGIGATMWAIAARLVLGG
ncbi:amino acid transporter [Salipiger aestuarii]|jgi:L-lysine exporter family protein LysE/ArgO|uniref:LysE/ArgO family amino acid transporter n=1 Tax=Salipiger aestuarii TaxID=568098 RepID=UPI00025B8415|nr:LysE/ArgO family amino acid transporter [Salipiger aestuarii]EIE50878.1 L-lysine exporter, putative [Citreicella sp. 357]KAA8607895.1 amino acid transporter [Salipiger aestuarii]